MDDEFFASVLKKWACSSQEVVDLKKRLGRVERERNEYERNVAVLKARCSKSPIGEKRPVPPGVEFEVLDLDDVENKLENARLEYQRRLSELNDVRNHEEMLRNEVQELRRERTHMQLQLQTGRTQYAKVSSELSSLRFEKDAMTTKIFDLTLRLEQAEKARVRPEQDAPGIGIMDPQQVAKLQEQMTSLETQLQEVQSLAQGLEVENVTLREELVAARGSLQKVKESNKGFRATIDQLSRIARNVAGAPEPAPVTKQEPGTPRAEITPPLQPQVALKFETNIKVEQKVDADFSFNDVTMVAESNNLLTSISPRRLEALASLPVIVPDTDINDEDNKFTRWLTSAAMRDGIRPLVVGVNPNGTEGRNVEEYLCPRLDHNPWCPSTPGQHGYMFIGVGKERNMYTTPQLRNLLVGLPKRSNKEERHFRYLGVYRVGHVDPLEADEWKSLHPDVQQNYLHTTKEKKDSRTRDEIVAAYNSGELSVHCVKLQCVDFDEELYARLLTSRANHYAAQKARAAKRSCNEDDETNAHSQRNKQPAH